jgi:hypothetical protein
MTTARTIVGGTAALMLTAVACNDVSSGQPSTEDGLRAAVQASTRAILDGDVDAGYAFFSERCQDALSKSEFAAELAFAAEMVEGFEGVRFEDMEIDGVLIEDFSPASAMAAAEVVLPSGDAPSGINDLSAWVYEDGGWKLDDDCEDSGLGDDPLAGDGGFGPDVGPDGVGERDQPVPVGEPASVTDEWELTVLEFEPDATDAVLAESEFSSEPGPGKRFATVRVRVTYLGEESGDPNFDLEFQLVGDAATGYPAGIDCFEANDPLPTNELFTGGTAEGNVCFAVPDGESGFGLAVAPWFSENDWWFDLP